MPSPSTFDRMRDTVRKARKVRLDRKRQPAPSLEALPGSGEPIAFRETTDRETIEVSAEAMGDPLKLFSSLAGYIRRGWTIKGASLTLERKRHTFARPGGK